MSYDLNLQDKAVELAKAMGETWAACDFDRRKWWRDLAAIFLREIEDSTLGAIEQMGVAA